MSTKEHTVHQKLDELKAHYERVEGKVDETLSHVVKTRYTTLIVGGILILAVIGLFAILL